jgi:hypothetical protein
MKKIIYILIILLFGSTSIYGQKIPSSDSLKIIKSCKTLFSAIKSNDMPSLMRMSTDKIYCIICSDSPDLSDSPYMFEKKDFLDNYLPTIKKSEPYQRATKSNELILINENGNRSDITVLLTIYKQNELAPEHEGVQFGIYFKKVNGEFRFAGIETIP